MPVYFDFIGKGNSVARKTLTSIFILLFSVVLFFGCGGGGGASAASGEEPLVKRTFPPSSLILSESSGGAETNEGVTIDSGNASLGYVLLKIEGDSSKRKKVIIEKDGEKYTYDINQEGAFEILPLQLGNGAYKISAFEQLEQDEYLPLSEQTIEAQLKSEFEPFIRPIQIINYNENSQSVKKAFELSAGCESDLEVAEKIYDFMKENIVYDKEKAQNTTKEYVPSPDETLALGKGICYDYAALAAAMLRANGIPTKLIKGNVSPSGVYHAWNQIYIENMGWIEKEIKVDMNTWTLIDTTFAASKNASDTAQFVGNGENYTQRYVY